MSVSQRPPGQTQAFVLPRGFYETYNRLLLEDEDGLPRCFFELTADPDHSHTEPGAAFEQFLSGMLPGTVLRVLHLTLPNTAPREAFLTQVRSWPLNLQAGNESLQQLMEEYLRQAPVPLFNRTIVELVVHSEEILDWADSVSEQFKPYRITARPLSAAEIQELAHWLFNPEFR